ncbi:hypothetical protein C4565_04855 [Candidatus Parcubacteria bacterium]|nr:MAG: hypothetical protein C4565_04855 [Candidatus Parcubacteria bacterium]
MFTKNRAKKRVRTEQFRCTVFVSTNNKVCHTVDVFSRYAHNLHDFLFLIHYNMEKELGRKILWTDISVKKIELLELGSWKTVIPNEDNIANIKMKNPR